MCIRDSGEPQRGGGGGVRPGGHMGGLVGEHDLLADSAEQGIGLRVDDHPVRRRRARSTRLAGGDRGDAPVVGGGRAEQARHALQRARDEDDDPPCPLRAPGAGDGRDGAVGEPGVAAQVARAPAGPQDQAVRAPDRRHRTLVPQLLPGLVRGPVGGDVPVAVRGAAEGEGATGADRGPVVAGDPVAQLGVGGGARAAAVQAGHPVGPGGQRERAQPGVLAPGARRTVGRLVVAEQGRRPPVEHLLHLGPRGVGRRRPAASGQGWYEQQTESRRRGAPHPPPPSAISHFPIVRCAAGRQGRVMDAIGIIPTGS